MESSAVSLSFKIVLLGDASVGKTSLLHRLTNDSFTEETQPTIGMAFSKKVIERKNMKITLEIWDTAGQEKFKKIAPIYYRNAQAVLIVFDLTRQDSFESAQKWLEEVERFLSPDCLRYLIGNKTDISNSSGLKSHIDEFIQQNLMSYIETSAKTGFNVHRLFRRVARTLAKSKLKKMDSVEQKTIIKLQIQNNEKETSENDKKHCCY